VSEIVLRRAESGDAATVAALATELGYPCDEEAMLPRLEDALAAGSRDVIVAEDEGEVVGWIELAVVSALESGEWVEIRGLIVAAGRRGSGIGKELVAAAESWAATRGYAQLRVRMNVKRERTKLFYEKCGFMATKMSHVFDKRVL
jgi:N-acetylglutamate synthase-like GNAT family acetyltransferase